MEGRGALRLGVCLLIAAAGCQHQEWTVPNSSPGSSAGTAPAIPAPGQVKKSPAKSKELPPPVWVANGDFKVAEAFHPKTEPDRRQAICELARADYEKALKADPKCVPAYQGLARLYSGMHDLPLAIETYQKALKLAPKNASLWYELGLCHNYRKDWGPALECLDRATQLDPGNRSYGNAKGVVLAAAGRYDDSLNCFVRSNGEAMGYYRLAQTLQHLQQGELSRRYLEAAVQKDPSLVSEMVMRSNSANVASEGPPQVQQTAYEAPSVPQAQAAPYPGPRVISVSQSHTTPDRAPQAISVNGPDSANQPPQRPVVLPPPPAINGEFDKANP
jgi:hypothetical protein